MHIRRVIATLATLGLGLALMPPTGAGATTDEPGARSGTDAARVALGKARSVLDADARTAPGASRDATLALRDLAVRRGQLAGSERASADRLLARPAGGERTCGAHICIHWTNGGSEGVDQTDTSPDNGIPDYVDLVLSTMEHVHTTYVHAGYRAPKPDRGRGGNNKRDIYLRNLGDQFLYGYCTTDQKNIGPPWDVWSYCVLDNNYTEQIFDAHTPTENMQVTAAHEYFHAVQFAYDFFEDGWFMEATATWAEDELYDGVNDNVQYLDNGQMRKPGRALDGFFASGNYYGNWAFFRYLTERLGKSKAGLPVIVRDMWRLADAKRGARDMYSLQAIKKVLAGKHRNLGKTYARFAEANRRTHATYDEGAAEGYPNARLWKSFTLRKAHRSTGAKVVTLDHLTSATAAFTPGGLSRAGWKLRIRADLADRNLGSRVIVAVFPTSGRTHVVNLRLNRAGNGQRTVAFRSGEVDHVEVTLVNASDRFTCGVERKGFGTYACSGRPKDDNVREKVAATAFR
jgi:hypothetical protein